VLGEAFPAGRRDCTGGAAGRSYGLLQVVTGGSPGHLAESPVSSHDEQRRSCRHGTSTSGSVEKIEKKLYRR
jgi:hypothetical protein